VGNTNDVDLFFAKDGGDDAAQSPLASYLPKTAKGKILVTSRSRDAAEKLTGITKAILQILVIDDEQALQLLRKKLDLEVDERSAIDLVRALNRIPLAVALPLE
ncbi:hypothetical protein ACHAQH_006579, partial [Verticillium albo-atrum]